MNIKKTQLLVLSGGFGSRLKKVIPDVPKALAPINKKKFLFYFSKKLVETWHKKYCFFITL